MAKMHSTNNCTSLSWGGEVFEADEKGIFNVPDEAVEDLLAHGLELEENEPLGPVPTKPLGQWTTPDLHAEALRHGLTPGIYGTRQDLLRAVADARRAKAEKDAAEKLAAEAKAEKDAAEKLAAEAKAEKDAAESDESDESSEQTGAGESDALQG